MGPPSYCFKRGTESPQGSWWCLLYICLWCLCVSHVCMRTLLRLYCSLDTGGGACILWYECCWSHQGGWYSLEGLYSPRLWQGIGF